MQVYGPKSTANPMRFLNPSTSRRVSISLGLPLPRCCSSSNRARYCNCTAKKAIRLQVRIGVRSSLRAGRIIRRRNPTLEPAPCVVPCRITLRSSDLPRSHQLRSRQPLQPLVSLSISVLTDHSCGPPGDRRSLGGVSITEVTPSPARTNGTPKRMRLGAVDLVPWVTIRRIGHPRPASRGDGTGGGRARRCRNGPGRP